MQTTRKQLRQLVILADREYVGNNADEIIDTILDATKEYCQCAEKRSNN